MQRAASCAVAPCVVVVRFHSPSRGVATVYLGLGSPHLSYNISETFDVLDDVFYLRVLARVTRIVTRSEREIPAGSREIHRDCFSYFTMICPFRRFVCASFTRREYFMIRERRTKNVPRWYVSLSCFFGPWLDPHEKIIPEITVIASYWLFF